MKQERENQWGQAIGFAVDWQAKTAPPRRAMEGRTCRLEPLSEEVHATDLFEAISEDREGQSWTYMAYGPFQDLDAYRQWMRAEALGDDPLFHAIIDLADQKACGVASYLRIEPKVGVIETGHIHYSPRLQRSALATETMYLMMRRVFEEMGYRRYEWKCDALNAPSRRAAKRLGFQFEGIFRQATVYKGRNRDTAWFAITDQDWPRLKAGFEAWLDPANFTSEGLQIKRLEDFMQASE